MFREFSVMSALDRLRAVVGALYHCTLKPKPESTFSEQSEKELNKNNNKKNVY